MAISKPAPNPSAHQTPVETVSEKGGPILIRSRPSKPNQRKADSQAGSRIQGVFVNSERFCWKNKETSQNPQGGRILRKDVFLPSKHLLSAFIKRSLLRTLLRTPCLY